MMLMNEHDDAYVDAILYSKVKRLKWKLGLVCLEIVLILIQDMCTVYMEHTICSKINLDAPDETPK